MKNDYRNSHKTPGKGKSYDKSFKNKNYRNLLWSLEKNILRKIIKKYKKNNININYLDFACGTGRIASLIEDKVTISYGIDVSEEMLNIAQKNTRKTKLIRFDITKNNALENKKFNLITAFRFFLNAQPKLRQQTLRELKKLLSDKGIFIFNIHRNHHFIRLIISRFYKLIFRKNKKAPNTMSIKETKEMLKKENFKIIKIYHIGILPIGKETIKFNSFIFKLIKLIELVAIHITPLQNISRYLIFVCKKSNQP